MGSFFFSQGSNYHKLPCSHMVHSHTHHHCCHSPVTTRTPHCCQKYGLYGAFNHFFIWSLPLIRFFSFSPCSIASTTTPTYPLYATRSISHLQRSDSTIACLLTATVDLLDPSKSHCCFPTNPEVHKFNHQKELKLHKPLPSLCLWFYQGHPRTEL